MESARVREKGDISSSREDKKAQKRRGKEKKRKVAAILQNKNKNPFPQKICFQNKNSSTQQQSDNHIIWLIFWILSIYYYFSLLYSKTLIWQMSRFFFLDLNILDPE